MLHATLARDAPGRVPARYEAAGGRVWPRMQEHVVETWAAYPVVVVEFALLTGQEGPRLLAQHLVDATREVSESWPSQTSGTDARPPNKAPPTGRARRRGAHFGAEAGAVLDLRPPNQPRLTRGSPRWIPPGIRRRSLKRTLGYPALRSSFTDSDHFDQSTITPQHTSLPPNSAGSAEAPGIRFPASRPRPCSSTR